MATYTWSIPSGNTITGSTKIKDTDNYLANTVDDLVDFVNGEGSHSGAGLTYDLVSKNTAQTISGQKTFSSPILATGGVTGNVTGSAGSCTGNSATATKLATARTITLSGGVSGSASFDGSADVTISVSTVFVSGMIMLWSGSSATIPSGWYLCDGYNGTPNLQDRFVIGAGSSYAVGATGGNKDATLVSHSHTASSYVSDPGHSHIISHIDNSATSGAYLSGNASGGSLSTGTSASTTGISVSTSIGTTGSSATNANLPPYYALCYIMKA